MVDTLLCWVRCWGREVTLNEEGGTRCRIGVGTILFSSSSEGGTGSDSVSAMDICAGGEAGAGGALSSLGIMKRKASIMSSVPSSSSDLGTTVETGTLLEVAVGMTELPACAERNTKSGPREEDLGGGIITLSGTVMTSLVEYR